MVFFMMLGCVLAVVAVRRNSVPALLAAAAAVGLAGASKWPAVGGGAHQSSWRWPASRLSWRRRALLGLGAVAAAATAFVAVYWATGDWTLSAFRYALEFQTHHGEVGHPQLVAGTVYQVAPWWSNWWWQQTYLGVAATVAWWVAAVVGLWTAVRGARRRSEMVTLGIVARAAGVLRRVRARHADPAAALPPGVGGSTVRGGRRWTREPCSRRPRPAAPGTGAGCAARAGRRPRSGDGDAAGARRLRQAAGGVRPRARAAGSGARLGLAAGRGLVAGLPLPGGEDAAERDRARGGRGGPDHIRAFPRLPHRRPGRGQDARLQAPPGRPAARLPLPDPRTRYEARPTRMRG